VVVGLTVKQGERVVGTATMAGTVMMSVADLSNMEIRVVDAAGRRVLGAVQTIDVQVSGTGALAVVDSGDIRDITPVQSGRRKVFEGRMLAIVRAGTVAGSVIVRASAQGLKPAEIALIVR